MRDKGGPRRRWIPRGTETVLLVEDNEELRKMLRGILTRQGYSLLMAANGAEALNILADYGRPLHLLLTDVVMPGMNGKELYKKCAATHPRLKVLFMSGYTNNIIGSHGVLDRGVDFIQKPFSNLAMAQKVREVLDKPNPPR